MDSVLLGLAAPAVAGTAGSVVEHTLQTAAEPFSALLDAVASVLSPAREEESSHVAAVGHEGKFEVLRSELADEIENMLASAGVELAEPIELKISRLDGQLEVVGDHPQKALIEAALADRPQIASEFTQIAVIERLLGASESANDAAKPSEMIAQFRADDDGATLQFR